MEDGHELPTPLSVNVQHIVPLTLIINGRFELVQLICNFFCDNTIMSSDTLTIFLEPVDLCPFSYQKLETWVFCLFFLVWYILSRFRFFSGEINILDYSQSIS